MPFCGNFSAVSTGDMKSFSIDLSAQIATGDAIATQTSAIAVVTGADPNAASLLFGSATKTGNVVSQWIGGAFVPGVIYRWTLTVTTTLGSTLVNHAHLACLSVR